MSFYKIPILPGKHPGIVESFRNLGLSMGIVVRDPAGLEIHTESI